MGHPTAKTMALFLGPGVGVKITKTILKIFIPNFVCVLTNKRYIERDFCSDASAMPKGWGLGALWLIFNMVMWHIKLTEMMGRTECM